MVGEIVAMFRKHQSIKLEFRLREEFTAINIPVFIKQRVSGGSEPRVGPGSSASRKGTVAP